MTVFKSNTAGVSGKLALDQYYTPYGVAEDCFSKLLDIVGDLDGKVFLEPSAGEGVFFDIAKKHTPNVLGIDLEPKHPEIMIGDFLTADIVPRGGVSFVTFGNPPFGSRLSLATKFFNKATEFSDYIAFILPISQLNNVNSLYRFDLIYSEDIGKVNFSVDRVVHCCFNIYKRPKGAFNKKPTSRLTDVKFVRNDATSYGTADYDMLLCYWGDGSGGKLVDDPFKHAGTYKIQVKNRDLLDKVVGVLTTVDWSKELNSTAMTKIQIHHVVSLLRREIPEIK